MSNLTNQFRDINQDYHSYNFYILQKNELKNAHIVQISLIDFVNKVFKSKHFDLFKNFFKNIKNDFLYKSVKHGKNA